MKTNYLKLLFIFILGSTFSLCSQNSAEKVNIPQPTTVQQERPIVILLSLDGFRHDYVDKFDLPFLKEVRKRAVTSKALIPSFPSVTYPNHQTMITGMLPAHHGLVANKMYDSDEGSYFSMNSKKDTQNPDWFGGIPLWSLAESQKVLTASLSWPGSQAEVAGHRATYYFGNNKFKGVDDRIEKVAELLQLSKDKRPHFITMYFGLADSAGHTYGTDAIETEFAAKFADGIIAHMEKRLSKLNLPINYIVVSDHGMTNVDMDHPLRLPKIKSSMGEVINLGTSAYLYLKDKSTVDSLYKLAKANIKKSDPYRVYKKSEIPEKYGISEKDDYHNRVGDLVIIAEAPYYLTNARGRIPFTGVHGYHPDDAPDMNGIFFAWGPQIQSNKEIESFQNIHLYPLITELLGLKYKHEIDGDKRLVPLVLKK